MIRTLLITIIAEGFIVLGYSIWYQKPVRSILFTSILANILTQSLLWIVLNIFFRHYLVVLIAAEVLIWLIESFLLYRFPANKLRLDEAALISLIMNLASFGIGLFLPI